MSPHPGGAAVLDLPQDLGMDTLGARYLASRLRARARVGTTIILEQDDENSGLCAGDRGVVRDITPDGVVVEWERGLTLTIDPQAMPYGIVEAA